MNTRDEYGQEGYPADDEPIDAEAGARRDMFHAAEPKFQGQEQDI